MIFTIYLHGGICPNRFQAQEIVSFQGNHIRSSCGDVINLNLRLKFAVKIPDMDLLLIFHRKKKNPGNSGNSIRFFSHMDKYGTTSGLQKVVILWLGLPRLKARVVVSTILVGIFTIFTLGFLNGIQLKMRTAQPFFQDGLKLKSQ